MSEPVHGFYYKIYDVPLRLQTWKLLRELEDAAGVSLKAVDRVLYLPEAKGSADNNLVVIRAPILLPPRLSEWKLIPEPGGWILSSKRRESSVVLLHLPEAERRLTDREVDLICKALCSRTGAALTIQRDQSNHNILFVDAKKKSVAQAMVLPDGDRGFDGEVLIEHLGPLYTLQTIRKKKFFRRAGMKEKRRAVAGCLGDVGSRRAGKGRSVVEPPRYTHSPYGLPLGY